MLVHRAIKDQLLDAVLKSGKVTLLYGPRQAGKTTLSKQILKETGLKYLSINADQMQFYDVLSSRDLSKLRGLTQGYDVLFIDEGQRVPEIGITLKILHDELPELKILVTGSSSFLLSGRVNESLAGRKKTFTLLPVALHELAGFNNRFELDAKLPDRLIYGSYPEIITLSGNDDRQEYLRDISSSYIYKDILELEQIKYPFKIRDLLKLLAFQVGSQVSIHELCQKLGLNRDTVERYLDLLEQSFVIFKLPAFSRNPRNEISKSVKYYFYDNGIRNVMIDNFKPLDARNDIGALWEHFLIVERRKQLLRDRKPLNTWFWRTYSGTEIDYVEEIEGSVYAYEIKYARKGRKNPPKSWSDSYGENYQTINRENYPTFILS
jgi:predicted AAA+ superfamily ATPase